jgi:integrase
MDIGDFSHFTRAKRPKKLPVVLSRDEVARLIEHTEAPFDLMATLLYGSGLRLMDCLRLRVKDLDFTYRQIVVRDGKGNKDRVTVLPETTI